MRTIRAAQSFPSARIAFAAVAVLAGCSVMAPSAAIEPTASSPAGASAAAQATPPGLDPIGVFSPPAAACAGPIEWSGVPALVRWLGDAWHERDDAKRRSILDAVWGEDAIYQNPYGDRAVGRDALSDVMAFGMAPGQYIELRSWDPADMHHGAIRIAWRQCCPSGLSLVEGTEIATVGADGRFSRVVSFWSRFVEEPAETACDAAPSSATPTAPSAGSSDTTCRGPDVGWRGLPPVGQRYGQAWNERDPEARRALLDEVWADDGTFADLYVEAPVVGPEALSDEIGNFLEAGVGAYFEPRQRGEGDFHHGFLRMPWTYCDADDNVVWLGEDIAELDADGRLTAVLSFFIP